MNPELRVPHSQVAPAGNAPGAVQLHIERLVLDGLTLTGADAARLQSALESELAGLLRECSMPADAVGTVTVHASAGASLQLGENFTPRILARQAARSLHQTLGRVVSANAKEPSPRSLSTDHSPAN